MKSIYIKHKPIEETIIQEIKRGREMNLVFISYVHEDYRVVEKLKSEL